MKKKKQKASKIGKDLANSALGLGHKKPRPVKAIISKPIRLDLVGSTQKIVRALGKLRPNHKEKFMPTNMFDYDSKSDEYKKYLRKNMPSRPMSLLDKLRKPS